MICRRILVLRSYIPIDRLIGKVSDTPGVVADSLRLAYEGLEALE
ncbi:hypothetical protein Tco_1118849, partial [Tanacetum coccineum]